MDCSELELAIFPHQGAYAIDARFRADEGSTDLVLARMVPATFDLSALLAAALDIDAYGNLLTGMLFAAPRLLGAWQHARSYTTYLAIPLRLRLRLDQEAPELHGLHWEALQDPQSGQFLCLDERVQFSRVIDHGVCAPVQVPSRAQLRGLMVVANPGDLDRYGLSPIDVEAQVSQVRGALSAFDLTILDGREGRPHATPATLAEHLAQGYHLIYLICHGSSIAGETYLWLEDARGGSYRLSTAVLVAQIERLARRPLLMVLAACQSGGHAHEPLSDRQLGSRLAAIGVPAVIAMSGIIPADSVRAMMPIFFRNLSHDGMIEQALTRARAAVSLEHTWWQPILWTWLRDGKVWQTAHG
ncbi:MAG: CHAT domain-containing protein [Chloroflexales bacterium]|nr:CHAT domain-containing protein [Chloroflexales bacterium]